MAFDQGCWRRILIFREFRSVNHSWEVLFQEFQFSIVADDMKLIAVRLRLVYLKLLAASVAAATV